MAFTFKQFHVEDRRCGMKISTDGVLLGAWACVPDGACEVLDAGAGSGLISLMLAQRSPKARITALEIDGGAMSDLIYNVDASSWKNRIVPVCDDFACYRREGGFDMIVSNPPFFESELKSPVAERSLARHVVSMGYRTLIDRSCELLRPGGTLAMILPAEAESDVIFEAELRHMKVSRVCRVHTVEGKPPSRVMIQIELRDCVPCCETLIIRHIDGSWTGQYKNLTNEFYLNF